MAKALTLAGRVLFALIFVAAAPGHFAHDHVAMAQQHGLPMANILVPLSGIIALVGGLSVAVGWYTRIGATLLILFLVPVTLVMHNFWAYSDPGAAQQQMANFLKNVALIGAAMYITVFGGGPVSLDARQGRS